MPDFPALGYGIVTGRFLAGTLDDDVFPAPTPPAQGTLAPDAEPLSGSVVFSATAPVILVAGSTPPSTFFPVPLRVYLDDEGYLSRGDSREIALWATDDQDGNPYDWQWHVHFDLNLNGHGVYRAPFNFELPEGETIDLAIVAPVTSPSDGTIIIRGPVGPPGPGVTDLITAKGDMVAGTGPEAAAIIHVGAEGEYLTPDPAAETGLAWKPLPEGVKAYANLAEAEAVRTSEVGTLWVPSMNAAFYNLSTQWDTFKVAGAAELVITTTVTDSLAVIGTKKYVLQEFHVRAAATEHQRVMRVVRVFEFDTQSGATTPPTPLWEVLPDLPGSGYGGDGVAVTDPFGKWWAVAGYPDSILSGDTNGNWRTAPSGSTPQPYSVVKRDPESRAQIADPVDSLDIVNKQTLDAAVATAGLKHYADMAALDAVRVGEVGVLHVANMNAAFPYLSAGSATFAADGPGELVVESHVSDSPVGTTETMILQSFLVNDYATDTPRQVTRYLYFDITTGVASITSEWVMGQPLPTPQADYSIIGTNNTPSAWIKVRARSNADPSGLIRRDTSGRAQVANPAAAQDIANKQYVDAAVAAAGLDYLAPTTTMVTVPAATTYVAVPEVGTINAQGGSRVEFHNTIPGGYIVSHRGGTGNVTLAVGNGVIWRGPNFVPPNGVVAVYQTKENFVSAQRLNDFRQFDYCAGPVTVTETNASKFYRSDLSTQFTLMRPTSEAGYPNYIMLWPYSNAIFTIASGDSATFVGPTILTAQTGPARLEYMAGQWVVELLIDPNPDKILAPTATYLEHTTGQLNTTAVTPRLINAAPGTSVRFETNERSYLITNTGAAGTAYVGLLRAGAISTVKGPTAVIPGKTVKVDVWNGIAHVTPHDGFVQRGEGRLQGPTTIGPEQAGYSYWCNTPDVAVTLVNPQANWLPSPIFIGMSGAGSVNFTGGTILNGKTSYVGGALELDWTYGGWVITQLGDTASRAELRIQADRTLSEADSNKIFWGNDAAPYTITLGTASGSLGAPIYLAPFTNAVFNLVGVTRGPTQVSAATGPVRLDCFYGVGWVVELLVTPPAWGRWTGTQAAYDAIAVKDPNTLYVVV